MFPRATENAVAGHMLPAGRYLLTPALQYIEEWARRIEVNDDEHSAFFALRIGYCYGAYNVWNKTSESNFQITRDQWGTHM